MKPILLPIMDRAFKADPIPLYERIRDQVGPVAPVVLPSHTKGWLVTGYAAARHLLKDQRLVKERPGLDDRSRTQSAGSPLFRHLLMRDPPEHSRLRAIVAPFFTARTAAGLRRSVVAVVAELLDEISPLGTAELITTFATRLPLRVILALLDLPHDHEAAVRQWMDDLNDADLYHPERTPAIAEALRDFILRVALQRPPAAENTLMRSLLQARASGELSDDELCAMIFLLLGAGYETTSSLVGNGIQAMLLNPAEWSKLCVDVALASAAVEEVLRFESPLEVATPRYAADDVVFDNVTISRGELVLVALAAANRDPVWLRDADEFRIDRRPAPHHLAFGHGVHRCLGASLARIEGEISFAMLASRFPDLELAVAPEELSWRPGLVMRGLESLPVRFSARE